MTPKPSSVHRTGATPCKLQEQERAALEVKLYENRIALFQTIHRDCGPEFNRERVKSIPEPAKPARGDLHEKSAKALAVAYKHSVIGRLFRRVEQKRRKLDQRVEADRKQDDEQYARAVRAYEEEHKDWMEMRQIAGRILEGNPDACIEAITRVDPFSEISAIGSSVTFGIKDPALAQVDLEVHGEDVIPKEKKYLLESGKFSSKDIPKTVY